MTYCLCEVWKVLGGCFPDMTIFSTHRVFVRDGTLVFVGLTDRRFHLQFSLTSPRVSWTHPRPTITCEEKYQPTTGPTTGKWLRRGGIRTVGEREGRREVKTSGEEEVGSVSIPVLVTSPCRTSKDLTYVVFLRRR